MLFSDFTAWLTRAAASFLSRDGTPQAPPRDGPLRLAVIGAGITGSTAAYRLRALSKTTSEQISITIFEAADKAGGQIKTVLPRQNSDVLLETGATHFFLDDWCLASTLQDLNLSTYTSTSYAEPAVWDGGKFRQDPFCREQHPPQGNWAPPQIWSRAAWYLGQVRFTAELWLQYGQGPWTFRQAMKRELAKWDSFGRQNQPFSDLGAELDRVGLHNATTRSAQQYLEDLGVASADFPRDFVEPWTRTLFSDDLSGLTGLAPAMLPWQSSRQLASVGGGNAALVSSLIAQSDAAVKLNTRVTAIEQGRKHRYRLTYYTATTTTTESSQEREHSQEEFDTVLIAAPLSPRTLQSIRSNPSHIQLPHHASRPSHRRIHATHFTTMFGVPIAQLTHPPAPSNTSTEHGTDPAQRSPGWLNLRQHRRSVLFNDGCGPDDECDQFEEVYRVISTAPLRDEDLAGLVDQRYGASSAGSVLDRSEWEMGHAEEEDGNGDKGRNVGGLVATDRGRGELEIAPGLLYLAGGRRVLDTLEMGCRMGRNGAALVLGTRGAGRLPVPAGNGKSEL